MVGVLAVNLSGPFYCLREALPEMAGRGWGRAVVVARIAGKIGAEPAAIRRQLEELSPQKRLVTAEEVAALVLYPCREEARGITGQGLNDDGGTLM